MSKICDLKLAKGDTLLAFWNSPARLTLNKSYQTTSISWWFDYEENKDTLVLVDKVKKYLCFQSSISYQSFMQMVLDMSPVKPKIIKRPNQIWAYIEIPEITMKQLEFDKLLGEKKLEVMPIVDLFYYRNKNIIHERIILFCSFTNNAFKICQKSVKKEILE